MLNKIISLFLGFILGLLSIYGYSFYVNKNKPVIKPIENLIEYNESLNLDGKTIDKGTDNNKIYNNKNLGK